MNFRVTAIVLILALGLGAYVYFSEILGEQNQQKANASAKLLQLDLSQVVELQFYHSGDRNVLVKRGETWVLVQPVAAPGDVRAVEAFLDSLSQARVEDNLGSGDLTRYGLDTPAAVVQLVTSSGQQEILKFGRINPMQTLVYLQRHESDDVLLTSSALLTMSLASDFGWRDKLMIDADASRVARMRFSTLNAGSLSVRRDSVSGWVTEGDVPWRVDPVRIRGLLADLTQMSAVGIGQESKQEVERHGLTTRRFSAVLEYEDGTIAGDLVFGHAKGEGSNYAIVPDKPEIFRVDGRIPTDIVTLAREPRDHKVFRAFRTGDVNRIEVQSANDEFVLVRESLQRWALQSSKKHDPATFVVDPDLMVDMLEALATMKITDFPEVQPAPSTYEPPEIVVELHGDGGLLSGIRVGRKSPSSLHTLVRGVDEEAVFLVAPTEFLSLPFDLERLGSDQTEAPPDANRG